MSSFKILLHNIGYSRGLTGGPVTQDMRAMARAVLTPDLVRSELGELMGQYIREESPDVCCLVEVHEQAGVPEMLAEYPYADYSNKYGETSMLRKAPFHRYNCNGFFAREEVHFLRHYLRTGRKRLLYELHLPGDVTLFFGHFSLNKTDRNRQFAEVAHLTKERERVIVCVDFNIFGGEQELEPFTEQCGLQLATERAVPTHPSQEPSRMLDLFLHSPDINVQSCHVRDDVHVSDHLPVFLEYSYE